jgi:hypothetical protein
MPTRSPIVTPFVGSMLMSADLTIYAGVLQRAPSSSSKSLVVLPRAFWSCQAGPV